MTSSAADRVLFANRDVAVQARVDDPLADDILDVEQVIQLLLRSQGWRHFLWRQERLGRLVIGSQSGNRHQLTFWVTQRGQFPAEHAAGIDVDRAVQPFRLGNWRMPINHHRLATILSRPVVAHRKPELVGLSGGFSVQRKIPHLAGAASLHLLLHAGVCDDELALIENVMTNQIVKKFDNRLFEIQESPYRVAQVSPPIRG